MAAPSMSVSGVDDLLRVFEGLSGKVETRAIRSGLSYVGRRIRSAQREYAKAHDDTGNLRKSIGTKVAHNKKAHALVLLVGPRRKFLAGNGQPATRYAHGIEYGWRGQTKDPMIARSGEMAKPHVLTDFRKGIGNQIERLAAKGKIKL